MRARAKATPANLGVNNNEKTSFGSISTWLPLILVTISGLILVGVLFFLTWRRIDDGRTATEGHLKSLIRKQDEKFQELNSSLSGLKDIPMRLGNVETEVGHLSQIVGNEREQRLIASRQSDVYMGAPAAQPYYEFPIEIQEDDVARLPVSAQTFLARLSGEKPIIKYDPVKGLLVTDPEGSGHLVLVQDRHVPGELFYIVPVITRFRTKEEFYNHYEQYYDCNRPAAGEVWLYKLAAVDKVDGGWRLHDRGLLEIR
jgi:hypothetical protein